MSIMAIRKLVSVLKGEGVGGVLRRARYRFFKPVPSCLERCKQLLPGKKGLEIGGASAIFSEDGILPIYPLLRNLDNCNYAPETIWQGYVEQGLNFIYNDRARPGYQYIADAVDLTPISTEEYDYVLSSHVIEHIANPLVALAEWGRVLKVGGCMLMVVPHKSGTFDHKRPVTTLEHMIKDYTLGVTEDDLTHLQEVLSLHDFSRDPGAGGLEEFKERSKNNLLYRGMHHHVFDTRVVAELVNYSGFQIHSLEAVWPMHIVVLAEKLKQGVIPNNGMYLEYGAEHYRRSPFECDRVYGKNI